MEANEFENEVVEDVDFEEVEADRTEDEIWDTSDIDPKEYYGEDAEDNQVDKPVESAVEETSNNDKAVEGETKDDTFLKVTYNGEELSLSEADTITNAQKGLNYDKLKDKYDNDPSRLLIKELAEMDGISEKEFMEKVKTSIRERDIQNIMDEKDCDEDIAIELYEARMKDKISKKEEDARVFKANEEAKREQEFQDFVKNYPDVDADKVPKEVWDKVTEGVPLTYAYAMWENAKLKNDIGVMKQNSKNSQGEIKVGGNKTTTPKDPFEEAWDSLD